MRCMGQSKNRGQTHEFILIPVLNPPQISINSWIYRRLSIHDESWMSCLFVEDFTSQWLSVPLALLSKYGSLTGETPNPPVAEFI
jgi:hypothetical protein